MFLAFSIEFDLLFSCLISCLLSKMKREREREREREITLVACEGPEQLNSTGLLVLAEHFSKIIHR